MSRKNENWLKVSIINDEEPTLINFDHVVAVYALGAGSQLEMASGTLIDVWDPFASIWARL